MRIRTSLRPWASRTFGGSRDRRPRPACWRPASTWSVTGLPRVGSTWRRSTLAGGSFETSSCCRSRRPSARPGWPASCPHTPTWTVCRATRRVSCWWTSCAGNGRSTGWSRRTTWGSSSSRVITASRPSWAGGRGWRWRPAWTSSCRAASRTRSRWPRRSPMGGVDEALLDAAVLGCWPPRSDSGCSSSPMSRCHRGRYRGPLTRGAPAGPPARRPVDGAARE